MMHLLFHSLKLFVYNFVHGDLHPGNILVQNCDRPKLVLLDCGIATSLAPVDWENMHCVFMAIVRNEGHKIADLFLNNQQCSTLHEYRSKMAALVNGAVSDLNLEKVSSLWLGFLLMRQNFNFVHIAVTGFHTRLFAEGGREELFLYATPRLHVLHSYWSRRLIL